ncbi:MAG: nucleoside triphosphate pyrophosphohydrolase [Desulfobulbaceae bacterium]|nr:nucleoside triphosphate pyrophosphohydrolase [Desulfobulbaceae bacterium]
MSSPGKQFEALRQIIVRLRQPDGCPWDIKQTPESFKSYLIEETHELLEAIDRNEADLVKEELGDLLFQVLFLNQLFEEQGQFTLSQVISSITEKMIKRHPHVFGDETITSEEEQRLRWNQIKAQEKKEPKAVADLLDNVPRSLPGLRRAQRVSERVASNGFEWRDTEQAFAKLHEEISELQEAVAQGGSEQIADELGDVLFMLVNLGRLTRTNSEDALQKATNKFIRRFSLLEQKVMAGGRTVGTLSFAEQLALWHEVKKDLTENQ